MIKKSSLVNYDTRWINHYTSSPLIFDFDAYTPIETILKTIEEQTGTILKQENYKSKSVRNSFDRLYRNVIPHYKGWEVLYSKPKSYEDYHAISEKIDFKPRGPKQSLKRTVLIKPMRWSHELYPLIEQVETQGAISCQAIADQLNQKIQQLGYAKFFKYFEKDFFNLSKRYKFCHQNLSSFGNQKEDNNGDNPYEKFDKDLQNMVTYSKALQHFKYNIYQFVSASNLHDVLHEKKLNKTTKGWSVEMLDEPKSIQNS